MIMSEKHEDDVISCNKVTAYRVTVFIDENNSRSFPGHQKNFPGH